MTIPPVRGLLLSAVVVSAVVVGGCSGGDDSGSTTTAEVPTTAQEVPTTEPVDETGSSTSDADDDADELPADSPLQGLAETPLLEEHLPDLAAFEVDIETDNPNTRVIVFRDDGHARYKSVLVKRTDRLKILDLQGGPPLYEGSL